MHRGVTSTVLPRVAAVTLAAAMVALAGCSTTEKVVSAPDPEPSTAPTTTERDDSDRGDTSTTPPTSAEAGDGTATTDDERDDEGGGEGQEQGQGPGNKQNGNKQNGNKQNGQQGQGQGGGGQKPQAKLPAPWPSNEVSVDPAPAVAQGSGVQQRLRELGFWHNGNPRTVGQAITAVQKYHGLPRTGSLDQATLDALANQTVKPHGLADAGDIVEVDKARQILFLLEDGKTKWVFNVSTGSAQWYETENQNNPGERLRIDGITRNGFHYFFHAHEDGWRDGDLGELYRPRYFDGGIAVHGYRNVPNYPASSGCVRVTVAAMDFIWENDLMPMGMNVWVHGPNPEPGPRNG